MESHRAPSYAEYSLDARFDQPARCASNSRAPLPTKMGSFGIFANRARPQLNTDKTKDKTTSKSTLPPPEMGSFR
jgi:hypothetical protein